MNAKLVIGGLLAAFTLVAQPPGGPGGPRGRGFGPGGPGPGGPPRQTVTGSPYSGVEVRASQQVLANGNVIQHQETTNVFRDSFGRVRRETTRTGPDGQTHTMISISDPVANVVTELDATHKTAFQRPARFPSQSGQSQANTAPRGRGPMNGQARNGAGQANVRTEALAAQSMNGIMATGTRVTRTIPAGQIGNSQSLDIVHETWMSEDLKVPVMTKLTDPRSGTTTTQLTNINRSEPDATLFQVPSDFTVKKGGPGGPPPGPRRGSQQQQ